MGVLSHRICYGDKISIALAIRTLDPMRQWSMLAGKEGVLWYKPPASILHTVLLNFPIPTLAYGTTTTFIHSSGCIDCSMADSVLRSGYS